jgi:hypothetical protein
MRPLPTGNRQTVLYAADRPIFPNVIVRHAVQAESLICATESLWR